MTKDLNSAHINFSYYSKLGRQPDFLKGGCDMSGKKICKMVNKHMKIHAMSLVVREMRILKPQ